MQKYKISKSLYVLLVLIIGSLSIGYTYAYFSAMAHASGKADMIDEVVVDWYGVAIDEDENETFSTLDDWFDTNSIAITSNLKRNQYTDIKASVGGKIQSVILMIGSNATIDTYCRVKLEASYINDASEKEDCSEYIILATNNSAISGKGAWVLDNGYYYYKASPTSALTTIGSGGTITLASQLYLSENSKAEIYGKQVSITLTAELAQKSNDGYSYIWDLA